EGRITPGELENTPLTGAAGSAHILDVSAQGRYHSDLPITTTLGNFTIGGTLPVICVADPAVFDGSLPAIQLIGDFSKILNFDNFDGSTLFLDALRRLPAILDRIDLNFLSTTPLIGPKIAQLLKLADQIPTIADRIER